MGAYTLGSTVTKVPRDAVMRIYDLGGTNYIEFGYNNLTFDEVSHELALQRERGDIVGSRNGDSPVHVGKFRVYFRQFTDARATRASILDVLKGRGAVGSNWVKQSSAHERWNLNQRITYTGTPYSGASDGASHVATWLTCMYDISFAQDPNAGDGIDVSFSCYDGLTYTGPT